jgi:hypothetical protein
MSYRPAGFPPWITALFTVALSCAHPAPQDAHREQPPVQPAPPEEPARRRFDPLALEIPDPPRLPAVPEPAHDCLSYDPSAPLDGCRGGCPTNPPPGWPCELRCPHPPDVNNPACWATMPCPDPPDRRVKKCPRKLSPCGPGSSDECVHTAPVFGRIIAHVVVDPNVVITIGQGSSAGVALDWRATVLAGDSDQPLAGGEVTIVRVTKNVTVGKVRLGDAELQDNARVRFSPP